MERTFVIPKEKKKALQVGALIKQGPSSLLSHEHLLPHINLQKKGEIS